LVIKLLRQLEHYTIMGIKYKWLKSLVRERKISPLERMSSRVGYMGAGLLMAGQWTLEPVLFIIGFICVIIQVSVRKQWNLVVLQLNGLVAWTIHFVDKYITTIY